MEPAAREWHDNLASRRAWASTSELSVGTSAEERWAIKTSVEDLLGAGGCSFRSGGWRDILFIFALEGEARQRSFTL